MKCILLTGFEDFGGYGKNSSAALMEWVEADPELFKRYQIRTAILDVTYTGAFKKWKRVFETFQPDLAVSFGLSWETNEVKLERIALNLDDCLLPDNKDVLRLDKPIDKNAPPALRTLLPIKRIHNRLLNAGIPVKISNHAGAYLCNHIFFTGLTYVGQLPAPVPFGFIHLPPLVEQLEPLNRSGVTKDQLLQMVRIVIETSLRSTRAN